MHHLKTVGEVRDRVRDLRSRHGSIGFVPTMGNLHQGHLALVEHAARRCGAVMVSIYVNPLQFGANEDFGSYPRTLDADLTALERLGVAAVFLPEEATIYPRGAARQTRVVVPELGEILCGERRPTHFQGVTTVVARLFNIVGPDVAVFGRKDYQQLIIIRRMVADLAMPVEIDGVETARAGDGLALSSRNQYLDDGERAVAPGLYRTLQETARRIQAGSAMDAACERGLEELAEMGFGPDYLEVRRRDDLAPPGAGDRGLVVLAAANLGRARLIDNLEFDR
ncbi:MAG: pantoate--beta-alanine ligase [Gammaproteobacteria bacterium]|nr:pantoate--beta-alanine ligase [Gammaproteobacteria bacterium]